MITAAPRLSLPAGHYQIRLIVQGVGAGGTVFADVMIPKASASPLVCAGVHLEQRGAEAASATHAFAGGAEVRVHATASARGPLGSGGVSAVLERDGAVVATVPVVATPAGRGWWRLESSLTAPTERDRYRLKMEMDGQGLEGCSTEFTAAPS